MDLTNDLLTLLYVTMDKLFATLIIGDRDVAANSLVAIFFHTLIDCLLLFQDIDRLTCMDYGCDQAS